MAKRRTPPTDNNDPPADDDQVGYGRPPKEHQFKKGQSGNPKGRPKGSKNYLIVLRNELNKRIPVVENGQRKWITKLESAFKHLANKSAMGELRSLRELLNLLPHIEAETEANTSTPLNEADRQVFQSLIERIINTPGGNDENN